MTNVLGLTCVWVCPVTERCAALGEIRALGGSCILVSIRLRVGGGRDGTLTCRMGVVSEGSLGKELFTKLEAALKETNKGREAPWI